MAFNFPSSPTTGQLYTLGSSTYKYNGSAWILTATVAPFDAMAYSGIQINGGMEVDQELGGTVRTTNGYICDGWMILASGTIGQSSDSGSNPGLPGFTKFIRTFITTSVPALAAGDYAMVSQPIEGYRIARLGWGTTSAQPVTISFWVAHHITGTYSVSIQGGSGFSYGTLYTQSVADAWEYKTVTIPGCTTGTWNSDNTTGLYLNFVIAAGTTYTLSAANTWLAVLDPFAAPGQINGAAVTSAGFRLTGVTLLPGTQAPSAAQSPNIIRPYGEELVICQRYYETLSGNPAGSILWSWQSVGVNQYQYWPFAATKRTLPSVNFLGGSSWTNAGPSAVSTVNGVIFYSTTGYFYATVPGSGPALAADARI